MGKGLLDLDENPLAKPIFITADEITLRNSKYNSKLNIDTTQNKNDSIDNIRRLTDIDNHDKPQKSFKIQGKLKNLIGRINT